MERGSKIIAVGGILALSLVALLNPYTGALLHAQEGSDFLSNEELCLVAVEGTAWDQRFPKYVAEAIRRGLTVDACRKLGVVLDAPKGQTSTTGLSGNALLFITAVILLVLSGLGWLMRQSGGQVHALPAPPVQFAKIIAEREEMSGGTGLAIVMLIISSFGSAVVYGSATTILQEIAALLIWIGNGIFWGIFIIVGTIRRKQTHIVYSDIAVNLEKNIARLEKLQEQVSSTTVVADAISPGQQVHAGTASVDEAERFPRQDSQPWRGA